MLNIKDCFLKIVKSLPLIISFFSKFTSAVNAANSLLTSIFGFVRKYALLTTITSVLVAGIPFCYFKFFDSKSIKTNLSSVLLKTKEINKLYTGFFVIPFVDKQYRIIKEDLPGHIVDQAKELFGKKTTDRKKIVGICVKKYDVSVGYNNIGEILANKEVIDNVCHNRLEKLPNPEILAVNCVSTKFGGKYDHDSLCHKMDLDEKKRNELILNEIREYELYEKINKRGRESLKTLASVLCE